MPMAPEPKVPKAVARAREALKARGLDPSGQNLKQALPKEDLNRLASTFRGAMSEEAKAGYQQLGTDADRRNWIAQYVIDPSCAQTKGFNKTTAFAAQSKKPLAAG